MPWIWDESACTARHSCAGWWVGRWEGERPFIRILDGLTGGAEEAGGEGWFA